MPEQKPGRAHLIAGGYPAKVLVTITIMPG
jgi:hypothetical protein